MPTVVSVNLRRSAETMRLGARSVQTGIRKEPAAAIALGPLGVAGDVVADETHHGGPDQAVYLYSAEDLVWWESQLGRALQPGAFGENLTLSSFGAEPVRVGDRFRIGGATVEATAARIPCSVFATHLGEHDWVQRFAAGRRPGFYARVLEPGRVQAGDPVEPLGGGAGHPEVVATLDAYFDPAPPLELLRALLAAPVAERARREYTEKLERLTR